MSKTAPRIAGKPTRTQRARKPRKAPAPLASTPPQRRQSADVQLVGFPLQRVVEVHTLINDGQLVTIPALQKKWKVSRSTVKRDLQFMRTRLEMPLEWDDVRQTFHYTRPFPSLPFLILTREEALVIALAAKALAPTWGPSFARRFKNIVAKIAPVLGSAMSKALKAVEHVHGPATAVESAEFAGIMPLLEAIESRRVVSFHYAKPGATTSEARTVHPLDLGHVGNVLRLIAHDPTRKDQRDFVLTRIRNLELTHELFERPADFDARERVENCAGSHAGGPDHDICIALDPRAAACVREDPWHHSQQFTPLPDGRTAMTLRVGDLPGIRNRVLSWGSYAEVLAPTELRDAVHRELTAAAARYTNGASRPDDTPA